MNALRAKDEVDPRRFTGKRFTRRKTFPDSNDDYSIFIDGLLAGRIREQANARTLAAKLLADAAVAGFTLADLGLDQETAETYIREAIVHLAEPGTPGD